MLFGRRLLTTNDWPAIATTSLGLSGGQRQRLAELQFNTTSAESV